MDYGPLFKEKPVVMDDTSVRGLFYGWKTEDRRAIKLREGEYIVRESRTGELYAAPPHPAKLTRNAHESRAPRKIVAPFNAGEIMWVREAAVWGDGFVKFKADHPQDKVTWQSPMFLPRTLCRIFLQVIGVRAQRLHEVTPEEALREGLVQHPPPESMDPAMLSAYQQAAITALPIRWDEKNKSRPWASNPWVWVYGLRRVSYVPSWAR